MFESAAWPLGLAKSDGVDGLLVGGSPVALPSPPKRLPDGPFDWLADLLKLNRDPSPAPMLASGGGPAGVVELPNSDGVCLLVGVVLLASLRGGLFPKRPPPPEAPLKGFAVGVSVDLLGVEKKAPVDVVLVG